MGNLERGEVDLVVGEATYTLRLSVNVVCAMQKRTNKTFGQLVGGLMALDFVALRELMWMLLQKHHAKEIKTPEQAGDLIDEAGIETITATMEKLFELNKAPVKAGGETDPQPAQGSSTGTPSTSTHDAAA